MPATSPSQQRLFGMVLAAKRGQIQNPPSKIRQIAQGISEGSAADFARKSKRRVVSGALMAAGKSGY